MALALACLLVGATGCGGDDDSEGESPTNTEATGATELAPEAPGAPEGEVTEPAEPGPPEGEEEAEAVRAARSYVKAIDARDAEAVCARLAPGSLALKDFADPRDACSLVLEQSLGAGSRGGGPVWKGTRIEHLVSVAAEDDRARVTLEVFHEFADGANPSVEDTIVFLELRGDRWLVSKPDATLYRALGYREPPLRAFTPPKG